MPGGFTKHKEKAAARPAVNGDRRPAPAAPAPPADDRTGAYVAAALAAEVAKVAGTPEGARNITLNNAAYALGTLAPYLSPADTRAALERAAEAAGTPAGEAAATISSGLNDGVANPRPLDLGESWGGRVRIVPMSELLAEHDDFWDSRQDLAQLRAFALSRMVSPWAMLGVVLTRVLASVPPGVRLPAIVGGVGNLNLFVCLVGESGTGKDVAAAAAAEAVDGLDPYTANLGSGEGIAHQYAHLERPARGGDWEQKQDRDSVLFTVPEVDLLTALGNRHGSTLLGVIKSAFSGHRLGFAYADRSRRIDLPANSYRLCLIMHAQPLTCGPLIDEGAGGLPQRFIWLPSTDPAIVHPAPAAPAPLKLASQQWPEFLTLSVPEIVAETIGESRAARARGQAGPADLDGQSLYCREKAAQALALLDGRRTMAEDDWELSGRLMAVSDMTRASVVDALKVEAGRIEQARHVARGHGRVTEERFIATERLDTARNRILTSLERAGGTLTHGQMMQRFSSPERQAAKDAIAALAADRQISTTLAPDGRIATITLEGK